jgi:SAM-dependent methyltransferase
MVEGRYWQNWDKGTAAQRIDEYWSTSPFEIDIRRQQASDVKSSCGSDVPIFEVGCGSGLMASALFAAGVTRGDLYLGGDTSIQMLAMARRRHPTVTFTEFDLLGTDAFEKHDNVVSFHVLQHLPSYRPALARLLALTRRCLHIVTWLADESRDQIRFVESSESQWGIGFYNNIYSLPAFLGEIESLCGVRPTARQLHEMAHSVSVRLAG